MMKPDGCTPADKGQFGLYYTALPVPILALTDCFQESDRRLTAQESDRR